jgi:hypothetical protein
MVRSGVRVCVASSAVACWLGCSDLDDARHPLAAETSPATEGPPPASVGPGVLTGAERASLDECAVWTLEPAIEPASLMLVVDASSSMNDTAEGTGELSKWEVARAAMLEAVESLPDAVSVGLLLYPNMAVEPLAGSIDSSRCVNFDALVTPAPLGSHPGFQRALLQQVLRACEPQLCTPTHDAYRLAWEHLDQAITTGSRFMALITDGRPTLMLGCQAPEGAETCGTLSEAEEQVIIDEIALAAAADIRTFVVGAPGTEDHSPTGVDGRVWLSQAALAGGTAGSDCSSTEPPYCHLDITEATDFTVALADALAWIAGHVVSCHYPLPEPVLDAAFDPDRVNVVYTGSDGEAQLLPRSEPDNCGLGWHWSDEEPQVTLCPETCHALLSDAGARLGLIYGCQYEAVSSD